MKLGRGAQLPGDQLLEILMILAFRIASKSALLSGLFAFFMQWAFLDDWIEIGGEKVR